MTDAPPVYFDTCTLWNFAAVDRLDLLRSYFGGRARWTDAIRVEVRRGIPDEPRLHTLLDDGWLGTPVDVDGGLESLLGIEQARRALGGVTAPATLHLGEAQMLYHLGRPGSCGIMATDDRPARDLALHRQISTVDSCDILGDCYQADLISCPDAYELLLQMRKAGWGVVVPESHYMICPPATPTTAE